MANWREINEAIARCRRGGSPVSCLMALFQDQRDGHVAYALGEEYQRLGKIEEARRWFTEAGRLYPRPEEHHRELRAKVRAINAQTPGKTEEQHAPESKENQQHL